MTAFDAFRTIVLACAALHGSGCYHGSDAKGYCSFPRFLWETGSSERPSRNWIGQTEYFGNTDTWITQQVITAQETEIIVKRKVHVPCTQQKHATIDKLPPCYRQETFYNIICLSEEPNGNYRVQQLHDRDKHFTCLKFEKQNANLIQVYRAELNIVNKDRLCYDESLTRDDWPWRASEKYDWSNCSLRGGFDFYSYGGNTHQQHCPDVWRPSRLESECLAGDGLNFIFPNQSCSFFYHPIQEQQFRCFSSWQDSGFTFILFGEAKLEARYILRLPSSPVDRFSAFLYLSPVAPIGDRGQMLEKTSLPTTSPHVTFYELRMKRSESGVCYDESERCPEHARKGKCTNAVPFEYANYCKKSCRLCDFVVSDRPECKFPSEFIGDWVLFSPNDKEQLTIDIGRIRFSTLGRFVCKNRHWQNDYYKLFTAFDNGCRPRHTCIMLSPGNDETLTMRMSSSDRKDRSFELCEAHSDQESFGTQVRNWKPKVLLPLSSLADVSCGLGRYMSSEVTYSGGLQCLGYISDISPTNCSATAQLSVTMSGCRYRQQLDFHCVALAKVSERVNFLVTKVPNDALINSEQIICWLVIGSSGSGVESSSSSALVTFQRARCDTREQILISKSTRDILYIRAFRVPPNATVPCGRKTFAAESNEVFVIDNRPSQSALLSYVHQSVQSRTPASEDDPSLDRDEEPLGQWRQKALAPPHDYEGDGDNDAAAQADDRGSRTIAKSKAPNYRSIDDDEIQNTLGKDESKRAMLADPWLVVSAWLTVSVIGRCWCWYLL